MTTKQQPPPQETIAPMSRKHKVEVRLAVLGVSANQLSKAHDVHPQQFSTWANSERRDAKESTLQKLADCLGVDLEFVTDLESWDGLFSPPPSALQEATS